MKKELEPKRTRNKPATKIDMELLKADVLTYPDSHQYECAARLGVSKTVIYWALKRLGEGYKKTLCHPKADVAKRLLFQEKIQSYKLKVCPLAYLDESGFAHDQFIWVRL